MKNTCVVIVAYFFANVSNNKIRYSLPILFV